MVDDRCISDLAHCCKFARPGVRARISSFAVFCYSIVFALYLEGFGSHGFDLTILSRCSFFFSGRFEIYLTAAEFGFT